MQFPPSHDDERKRIIRGRNRALGLVLAAFAVLFFFITIAKLQH